MSNSDSQKPSDHSAAAAQTASRHRSISRRLTEMVLFVLAFALLSQWLSRHLLADGTQLANLQLPRLANNSVPGNDSALTNHPSLTNNSVLSHNSALTHNSASYGQLQWPAEHDKTLIYFFAPWCGVCRVSMPGLNTLPDNHRVRVVAIALDYASHEEVARFIDEVGFKQEVLLGNAALRAQFNVQGYPSYYVADRDGRVIHQDRGLSTPPGLWLRTQL